MPTNMEPKAYEGMGEKDILSGKSAVDIAFLCATAA